MCEKPVQCTTFPINTAFSLVHILFVLFVNCIRATTNWVLLGLLGHLEDLKLVDPVNKTSLLALSLCVVCCVCTCKIFLAPCYPHVPVYRAASTHPKIVKYKTHERCYLYNKNYYDNWHLENNFYLEKKYRNVL